MELDYLKCSFNRPMWIKHSNENSRTSNYGILRVFFVDRQTLLGTLHMLGMCPEHRPATINKAGLLLFK